MPRDAVPDLMLPGISYGKTESHLSLRALLYSGGAAIDNRKVNSMIDAGLLGPPLLDRLPLVQKLHDAFAGRLAARGSRHSAKGGLNKLRAFYAWADREARLVTLASIETDYIDWTDHLLHRKRIVGKVGKETAVSSASKVASLLDEALGLTSGLLVRTRLSSRGRKKRALGTQAEKQNLTETYAFGHALLDIADALTVDVIRGPLPVDIRFRSGKLLSEWSGLIPPEKLKLLTANTPKRSSSRKKVLANRAAWQADTTRRTRSPLINLRIEAEMLIFIAQTGMNLSQAHKLRVGRFSYQSYIDGYQVRRVYKGRRRGEVEFEIYSEYRPVFERYLSWRAEMFPDDEGGLLFPHSSPQGRSADVPPTFKAVTRRCAMLEIRYFGPRSLRNTRVNWLLRRSGDPALTAEIAQHTQETLFRDYDQPHHQVAVVEISRFHLATDPAISPPGPGTCIRLEPVSMPDIPDEAPKPDCVSPAGCVFCSHQRDVDTADHVWSLASYRHYKSLELALYRPAANARTTHPASTVIERLGDKLKAFEGSSEVRATWVKEAQARINEGEYHRKWDGFIRLMEIRHGL